MTPDSATCPKCRTSMEEGLLLDKGDHNSLNATEWLKGEPERSFWTGLKTKGKERHVVRTFRCPGCGYLESYA